jgi:hypothetical protein
MAVSFIKRGPGNFRIQQAVVVQSCNGKAETNKADIRILPARPRYARFAIVIYWISRIPI